MSETKLVDINPSKNIVVIRPTELPSSSLIPPVTSNAPQVGEVIAIGKSKTTPDFKIGSTITYRQYGEYEFFINGETIYFVKFEDILGVINFK